MPIPLFLTGEFQCQIPEAKYSYIKNHWYESGRDTLFVFSSPISAANSNDCVACDNRESPYKSKHKGRRQPSIAFCDNQRNEACNYKKITKQWSVEYQDKESTSADLLMFRTIIQNLI